MVRMPNKKTLMLRNIDIRIRYAAGYSEKEVSEMCGMGLDVFRKKWNDVLERVDYLSRQGFEDDVRAFMNDGIFCIKGFKEVAKIA